MTKEQETPDQPGRLAYLRQYSVACKQRVYKSYLSKIILFCNMSGCTAHFVPQNVLNSFKFYRVPGEKPFS